MTLRGGIQDPNKPKQPQWLLWSIEHSAWWKPNNRGYTRSRADAGRYSFEEACQIVTQANVASGDTPNEAMVREEPSDAS